MRSACIEFPETGRAVLSDIGEPPEPSDGQILIGTRYSGITNGTERHALMAEHGMASFPGRHGYQNVGVVERVGVGVDEFKEGDWVFCGRYEGHRGWLLVDVSPGEERSFRSHLTAVLPKEVDYRECALLGVAGVAMRGIRRFRIAPAKKVWVAGAGLIGQFSAQAARAVGEVVTVSDLQRKRLEIAKELGADRVVEAGPEEAWEALKAGGPYDCIIDACGAESLFLDIHRHGLLARGGVIGALAVRDEATFNWHTLHGAEGAIEVTCHFGLEELRILLHFLREGIVRVKPLVTHQVSVDKAPEIYGELRDDPSALLGVIFDWTE